MNKYLLLAATWALIALFQSPAQATLGGRTVINSSITVKPLYIDVVRQEPGVTWTFSTSGLSPGSDSVIHVQSDLGAFIAGNDEAGPGSMASSVTVPSAATARTLIIIVRAYSITSEGTCTYTRKSASGRPVSAAITLSMGFPVNFFDTLAVPTRVNTTQPPGGTSDTVLLLYSDISPAHAVGFDDDRGADRLSKQITLELCTTCKAIIAGVTNNKLVTNLIWDQEFLRGDADGDGLGTTLESIVGTSDSQQDSDQDGISDLLELYGDDSASGSLNFPMMGADPAQKDLFFEVDWQECTDPDCKGNLDLGQLGQVANYAGGITLHTDQFVSKIQTALAPVRVHLDLGHYNRVPATLGAWGNWGGAKRGDYRAVGLTGCEGASPERKSLFHFVVSSGPRGGGTPLPLPGSCMTVTNNMGDLSFDPDRPALTFRHETGHMLGLDHFGRPKNGALTYKANYPSFMNYLYGDELTLTLSHGTAPALNPTMLDETLGVGPLATPQLIKLQKDLCLGGPCVCLNTNPGGPCADARIGSVDWNRDGEFSSPGSLVRGAVTLWGGTSVQRHSTFVNQMGDASLAWVTSNTGDQLFMVGRSDSKLQYAWVDRTALDLGCGVIPPASLTDFTDAATPCANFSTPTDVTSAVGLSVAPGVAELTQGILMVVWQGSSGTLKWTPLVVVNGAVVQHASVALPGAATASGDVTAVSTAPGVVKVWAPAGGNPARLTQWTYQNSAWTGPVQQQWTDGAFISTQYGIGATMGFQDGSDTANLYAAIVDRDSQNQIVFARQEVSGRNAGRWTKLPAWTLESQPYGLDRPGLAYQRTGQAKSAGRFYMAFNQRSCSGHYNRFNEEFCEPQLQMTEGNMTTGTSRRLLWIAPTRLDDAYLSGGITLFQDLNRDLNLRAVINRWNPAQQRLARFLPLADGIFNTQMTDNDDFAYLTGALRASLGLDNGGVWPGGVLPPGLQ